jgi:ABC-type antimicrobial peptide transport system permease subunit
MLLLGLFAAWIPAQKALGVDPMILLREEYGSGEPGARSW